MGMAAKRDFTPYQQKVIRNYYRNQDGIQQQALADLVSDLYLATTDAKRHSLWKRAEKLMTGLGVLPQTIAAVLAKRNLTALAEIVSKGFAKDTGLGPGRAARDD